jgi:hypothetical protein
MKQLYISTNLKSIISNVIGNVERKVRRATFGGGVRMYTDVVERTLERRKGRSKTKLDCRGERN